MKTIEFVNNGNHFVAIKSELVEVNIVRTIIYMDGHVTYIALNQNMEYSLSDKNVFYDSKEDFLAGKPSRLFTVSSSRICSELNCSFVKDDLFEGWVFNDNIAEKIQFHVDQITIIDDKWSFMCSRPGFGRIDYKFYASRQEVLDDNIVKVLNEDGTETEIVGISLRVRLDDDQLALTREMRDLVSRMEKAGMSVVFDAYDESISFLNVRSFSVAEPTYDGDEFEYEYELGLQHLQERICLDGRVDECNFIGANRKDD